MKRKGKEREREREPKGQGTGNAMKGNRSKKSEDSHVPRLVLEKNIARSR